METPKTAETVTINLETYEKLKADKSNEEEKKNKALTELEQANIMNKIIRGLITAMRLYQNGASAVDHIRMYLDEVERNGYKINLSSKEVEIYKIK